MTISIRSLDPSWLTRFTLEWEKCGWEVIPTGVDSPIQTGWFTYSVESPTEIDALPNYRLYLEDFPLSHRHVTDGDQSEELRRYWAACERIPHQWGRPPVAPKHFVYHNSVQAPANVKVSELKFPEPTWHLEEESDGAGMNYAIHHFAKSGFVCRI